MLRHRPREVPVVGGDVADRLVEAADRQAELASPAHQVLDRRLTDEVVDGEGRPRLVAARERLVVRIDEDASGVEEVDPGVALDVPGDDLDGVSRPHVVAEEDPDEVRRCRAHAGVQRCGEPGTIARDHRDPAILERFGGDLAEAFVGPVVDDEQPPARRGLPEDRVECSPQEDRDERPDRHERRYERAAARSLHQLDQAAAVPPEARLEADPALAAELAAASRAGPLSP